MAKYASWAWRPPRPVLDDAVAALRGLQGRVVGADEREGSSGRRALLNYGHTLATLWDGRPLDVRHGEAVAIGLSSPPAWPPAGRIDTGGWPSTTAWCRLRTARPAPRRRGRRRAAQHHGQGQEGPRRRPDLRPRRPPRHRGGRRRVARRGARRPRRDEVDVTGAVVLLLSGPKPEPARRAERPSTVQPPWPTTWPPPRRPPPATGSNSSTCSPTPSPTWSTPSTGPGPLRRHHRQRRRPHPLRLVPATTPWPPSPGRSSSSTSPTRLRNPGATPRWSARWRRASSAGSAARYRLAVDAVAGLLSHDLHGPRAWPTSRTWMSPGRLTQLRAGLAGAGCDGWWSAA